MVDISINNKNAVITLEIQTKCLKAAEYICEQLDMSLDKYLTDCILCGVNADFEDQIIFSKSIYQKSLIDIMLGLQE